MKLELQLARDQRVNLFLIEKLIKEHNISLEDIGDKIPAFFHFNNPDLTISYLNKNGCDWIGHSKEEINKMGYDFFLKYIHPDTLKFVFPRFLEFYRKQDTTKTICDFQKIWDPNEKTFKICLTVSKLCKSKPGFLTITQPLDSLEQYAKKIKRIIEEDVYARSNHHKYESLTTREKEIVVLLLKGLNNPQVADQLYISRRTVEQHRKNINRKLAISSFADLYKFGYAFDMV